MHFQESDYLATAETLQEASEWLASIGVRIESSRLEQYRGDLLALAEATDAESLNRTWAELGSARLSNSVFEAAEWLSIYDALAPRSNPELLDRLRLFVKGPPDYQRERASSSSTRARDIAFELSLGARLVANGFAVHFGADADLSLDFLGYTLFVECKRPQTEGKVRSHISKALRQLARRKTSAAEPAFSVGIVALSATKLLNPGRKRIHVPTRQALDDQLHGYMNAFIRKYHAHWMQPGDARCMGAFVEFRVMATVEEGTFLVPAVDLAFSFPEPHDNPHHELSLELQRKFSGGSYRLTRLGAKGAV